MKFLIIHYQEILLVDSKLTKINLLETKHKKEYEEMIKGTNSLTISLEMSQRVTSTTKEIDVDNIPDKWKSKLVYPYFSLFSFIPILTYQRLLQRLV